MSTLRDKVVFKTPLHRLVRWIRFRVYVWRKARKGTTVIGSYDSLCIAESTPIKCSRRTLAVRWTTDPTLTYYNPVATTKVTK